MLQFVRMNASVLTVLQRCPRRYRLESIWRVLRVRPKELFDELLRASVFAISNGADAGDVAEEACTRFLETAARPGLDIACDPYVLAHDYCAMLRTALETISRTVLLTLKRPKDLATWSLEAFQDDSGTLHRWTSVSKWDSDATYREVHGWRVFGDCAATGQAMVLHVVEIGRESRGHQLTPWCRIYKHPAIQNHHRFRKTDGTPLESSWKPVWFQNSKFDAKSWVDQMQEDRVNLIHHQHIREPLPAHMEEFREELEAETRRANALPGDWQRIPRFRPACDLPPCPWQPACFTAPGLVNVEAIGGFMKR